MLNNYEEYYLEIIDKPKEELAEIAYKSFCYINDLLKKYITDMDERMNFLIDVVELIIACDGDVNEDEANLFNHIFESEFSLEDINAICTDQNESKKQSLNKLEKLKVKDTDFRDVFFLFCSCVAAIDDRINTTEQEFIEKHIRIDINRSEDSKA